jgi:lysophospholipase L1-like esterase
MALIVAAALLATGCGDGPEPTTRPPLVIAAVGDSITEAYGVDAEDSYIEQAGRRLGVGVRRCGVSGQRTDEIAERLPACARGARVLIVQGGVNDLAQGVSAQEAAANLRRMVRAGRGGGRRVLIAEVLPTNNGYPQAVPLIADLNRRIRAIGRSEHVEVLPVYRALEDPSAPGRMKSEWTVDGDHPSVEGHRRLAALVPGSVRG